MVSLAISDSTGFLGGYAPLHDQGDRALCETLTTVGTPVTAPSAENFMFTRVEPEAATPSIWVALAIFGIVPLLCVCGGLIDGTL